MLINRAIMRTEQNRGSKTAFLRAQNKSEDIDHLSIS